MTEEALFCYERPRPAVTVDIVLFRGTDADDPEVLLIRRRGEPYAGCWAFPGGFVEIDEPLDAAAQRELEEETGIRGVALDQLGAFGDPNRDPRGRTISIAYWGAVENEGRAVAADDAAEARWFSRDGLPELAFDHDVILERAVERYRGQIDKAR